MSVVQLIEGRVVIYRLFNSLRKVCVAHVPKTAEYLGAFLK